MTYFDRIGEADAVDTTAGVEDAEAAVRATATILRAAIAGADNGEELSAALTWLRDGAIGVGSSALKAAVRACAPIYLTPTLVAALVAPVWTVRHQAIYTLGKMTFREDLPLLLAVFERYADRDPLLLSQLIGEITWLGGDRAPLLAHVRRHPHYLTRWSFFGTQDAHPLPPDELDEPDAMDELKRACVELGADPVAVIRAEARYVLAEIELFAEHAAAARAHGGSTPAARKRQRAELEATQPLRFDAMALSFMQSIRGKDYDLDTLDAFVGTLAGSR